MDRKNVRVFIEQTIVDVQAGIKMHQKLYLATRDLSAMQTYKSHRLFLSIIILLALSSPTSAQKPAILCKTLIDGTGKTISDPAVIVEGNLPDRLVL